MTARILLSHIREGLAAAASSLHSARRGLALAALLGAVLGLSLAPAPAQAAGAPAEEEEAIDWEETPAPGVADDFVQALSQQDFAGAYAQGSELLRETRSLDEFSTLLADEGLAPGFTAEWTNGVPTNGGLRLNGEATLPGGEVVPVYVTVLEEDGGWRALDLQSSQSFASRLASGQASTLDVMVALFLVALLGAFGFIVWRYVTGLRGSPRELYLMFFTKVTEYSAYGAANLTFVLYLNNDIGLSDIEAGTYIGAWSMGLTLLTMVVGAVCDAIGIKKTLLIGAFMLLFSRGLMPLLDDLTLVTILGFVPLAVGIAITGPVLSVGIKMFTTRAGATLGFGLFYTLMNVGWAIGAWIFDAIRGVLGDNASTTIPMLGWDISTYQVIIAVGFFLTIPDLFAILLMRSGVEMTERGIKITPPAARDESQGLLASITETAVGSAKETASIFASVFKLKSFYVYLFMLGLLVFVRLTFYHFHYTFPTYGIRVFGDGVKVGSLFGVLNPLLIVFLVPLIASVTQKVRSYYMLLIGSAISAASVFLATFDPQVFAPLADTWMGTLIFDYWLEIPVGRRDPLFLSLVTFFIVFTIGEAIWSPRLMQFTAEIAPPGREGSYVALSYLPYFGAKFVAGPMSGWLLATYTPEGVTDYTHHYMVWVWIGGMAAISPLGMLLFSKMYLGAEDRAKEAADQAAAELEAQELAEQAQAIGEKVAAPEQDGAAFADDAARGPDGE